MYDIYLNIDENKRIFIRKKDWLFQLFLFSLIKKKLVQNIVTFATSG